MANTIKLKRASGSDPGASDLAVGEIAIRTSNCKLFSKNDGGSAIGVVAGSADTLTTARTIAGVSFDGSANISLNNNAITNGAGYITATLTEEQVEDYVGGMVTGNTETGITVTYDDSDGTLDFVVASQTENDFTTTLKNKLDGIAASAIANVVEDTSPQLGGDLDVQSSKITTATSNGNVKIEPNGSGVVEVRGAGGNDGTLQLNCSAQSHGIKLKSPAHSAGASYTLTFPDDIVNGQFLKTDASGNLSWAAVDLTSLSGSNITSGTVAAARVATLNQDTTGTAAIATTVTVADESSDTSCNILFATAATGNLAPKSGTNLTFNSSSGVLTATGFAGALTGNVTGNASGSSGSCTGNAATATALASARTIAGVSFDGTGNISLNNNAITNGAGYITATLTQEQVEDYVGGMLTGNTETGITVTYQDSDGTIDFVVGTLNQDTTGNAATATALETARNIGGVSFNGSANINLPGVNTTGNQNTSGTSGGFTAGSASNLNSGTLPDARFPSTLPAVDGSNLTGISAGATGGGSDEIFYENGQNVTTSYTITNGKNAMAAGPITIDSGAVVTVGANETLTIV